MAYDPRVFTAQETELIRAFTDQQNKAYLTFTAGKSWSADPTTRAREAETIRKFKRDQDAELTRFQSGLISKRGRGTAGLPRVNTTSNRTRPTTPRPKPTNGAKAKPGPRPGTKPRAKTGANRGTKPGTGSRTRTGNSSGTTRVRSYTRTDGTHVRSHDRRAAWKQAGAAWSGTAASGAVALALVTEVGFTLISTLAMIVTSLLSALAVKLSHQATGGAKRRRKRARAKTRRATARTATRRTTTRRTTARRSRR